MYVTGEASIHPDYPFHMTARDLARFGLLYLRDGVWDGRRILPEGWVGESLTPYSDAGETGGYGYLWWVAVGGRHFRGVPGLPDGLVTARGAGGHVVALLPSVDLVFVHRVNTFIRGNRVDDSDVGRLLRLTLDARIPA